LGYSSASELERAQTIIEYLLAAVVPSMLALMLFSYVLFDQVFDLLFLSALIVAAGAVLPARKMHSLHYLCWSWNSFPVRMTTSLIGMVYISAASVFSVAMVSEYEGLEPESPLTLTILLGLLALLLALLAYNARNRERFLGSQKRFYSRDVHALEAHLTGLLKDGGHHYRKVVTRNFSRIHLDGGLQVKVSPVGKDTEVLIENIEGNEEMAEAIKSFLD